MQPTAQHLLDTVDFATPRLPAISADAAARRPAPGKWSKKEILGHLIDSAGNNQQKFARLLSAPNHHVEFAGYAQDDWVAAQHYQETDWPGLVTLWQAFNRHLAHVIAHATPPNAPARSTSKAAARTGWILSWPITWSI